MLAHYSTLSQRSFPQRKYYDTVTRLKNQSMYVDRTEHLALSRH